MPSLDKEGVCLSEKGQPGDRECGLSIRIGFMDSIVFEDTVHGSCHCGRDEKTVQIPIIFKFFIQCFAYVECIRVAAYCLYFAVFSLKSLHGTAF